MFRVSEKLQSSLKCKFGSLKCKFETELLYSNNCVHRIDPKRFFRTSHAITFLIRYDTTHDLSFNVTSSYTQKHRGIFWLLGTAKKPRLLCGQLLAVIRKVIAFMYTGRLDFLELKIRPQCSRIGNRKTILLHRYIFKRIPPRQ